MARDRLHTVIDGKWQLEAVLGVGGMAAVYAARHRNGKRVAIKLLHPHLAVVPHVVQRFVREGYAANLVEHPGAVSVLDDGAIDGVPFLVMELLEGETADARCDRLDGHLALGDALAVTDAVLAVLEAGHRRGMVHRDIKPENIFLTVDGETKVLDFGIARIDEVTGAGVSSTQSGSSLGTPAFMPPEQARGERGAVGARTDLWSTGATLFYLISGKLVHDVPTVSALLVQVMTQRARSLATVAPGVPAPIVAVVDRALAFDPADRWASAEEMRQALRAAAASSAVFVPPKPSPAGFVPPPPPPRSSFASATSAVVSAPMPGPATTRQPRAPDTPEATETLASSRGVSSEVDLTELVAPRAFGRRGVVAALVALALLAALGLTLALRSDAPAPAGSAAPASAGPPAATMSAAPPIVTPPPSTEAPSASPSSAPPPRRAEPRRAEPRQPTKPTPPVPAPLPAGRRDPGESRN
ncbi:MAG: serine/threonine protein kinase [Polyangiaceae bacterium]|nr:serine/threonine protein kinase [Polyangiaceae bacterium]